MADKLKFRQRRRMPKEEGSKEQTCWAIAQFEAQISKYIKPSFISPTVPKIFFQICAKSALSGFLQSMCNFFLLIEIVSKNFYFILTIYFSVILFFFK